jgi:hypothetical protein
MGSKSPTPQVRRPHWGVGELGSWKRTAWLNGLVLAGWGRVGLAGAMPGQIFLKNSQTALGTNQSTGG